MVSVVVLTYNQEQMIGRTLDSILSQKSDYSFEIIVGEDASPSDNTRAVCEAYAAKYPQLIRLLPKAPNKGLMRNYADCLAECSGKYIACCAGDDWWHNPDKLQMQVEFLESNPDYGVVHTDCHVYYEKSTKTNINTIRLNIPQGDIFKQLMHSNFIYAPTVLYKSELLKYICFGEYIDSGLCMEDYPMWLEMSLITRFHHIAKATVTYTINEVSLSNNSSLELKLNFCEKIACVKRFVIDKYSLCDLNHAFVDHLLSRSKYMLCLQNKSYKQSFTYVDGLGMNKFIRKILSTYVGSALCSIYLKIKYK